MDSAHLENVVLSLLFSADEPISLRKIAGLLEDVPAADIKVALESLKRRFDDEAWCLMIEPVAGGFQLSSRPEYAAFIARLYSGRRKMRLSKAALEALAIIAYKQPITRAEIEKVRGVGCGGVLTNLMERSLIRITGKAKVLGAPFLYGTTPEFLEYLGLNALKDLPSMEELEALLEREESAAVETVETGEATTAGPEEPSGAAHMGPGVEEPVNRPLGGEEAPANAGDLVSIEEEDSIVDEEPGVRHPAAGALGERDE